MPGRHVAPGSLTPRVRRLGAVALTGAAVGTGIVALTGSAVAAPAAAPSTKTVHSATNAKSAKSSVSSLATGRQAVSEARAQIGKPYRYGGDGPSSFDCSGLTRYVYGTLGVDLPRTAAQQQDAVAAVPSSAKRPGDLIFEGKRSAYHVGIYAGNNQMIQAPESGEDVQMSTLPSSYTVGRPA